MSNLSVGSIFWATSSSRQNLEERIFIASGYHYIWTQEFEIVILPTKTVKPKIYYPAQIPTMEFKGRSTNPGETPFKGITGEKLKWLHGEP